MPIFNAFDGVLVVSIYCRNMLNKLQKKWRVGPLQLLLIIITFAIGGSLCGYAGRQLLGLANIEKGFLWVILYILAVTLLWPLSVILVSVPLGQFSFFKRYLRNMVMRLKGKNIQLTDDKKISQ